MRLINCKVELSLSWDPNCVLSNLVVNSTFTITDAKLYVLVATLSIEDNAKLSKLLSEGFKRSVYWNKASYQGVKRLFVLAYRDRGGADSVTSDSHRRYSLPRANIENTILKLMEEIFLISQLMT